MQDKVGTSVIEHNDELKKELDRRYADYKNGTAKLVTAVESKRRIRKVLKAATKK
jgi:Putative addiction module component